MGRQVRFYMTQKDEQEFLDFVFLQPTVKFLCVTSDKPEFNIEREILIASPNLPQIFIWNSAFPLDEKYIQKIYRNKYDENLGVSIETNEAYFTIDRLDAPLITYSRSFIRNDGRLHQGRVWAEMYRVVGDQFVHKELGFIAWYDEIAKWLRKNLKRDKTLHAYVAKDALEWQNQVGEFH